MMRRAHNVFNVAVGNFFEMYDFMVFGLYASYIAKSFFPNNNVYISLLLSFLTFGAGFLMRPLGAIILGAYIDRHGRKKGLLLTLSLMAIGTISIALTPTYATIGVAAPIIILFGRLIQGFSAGAELGGVAVYLAEIADNHNKGFFVSWQSASQQMAIAIAALFGYILNEIFAKSFMESFGWRIPFIFGCLILPILFIQRSKLEESKEFDSKKIHPSFKAIISSAIKNFGFLVACSFMVMLTTVSFYMITAYTPTFAKVELGISESRAFILTLIIALSNFILLPLMGILSDKIGRFRQLLLFSILFVITAYPVLSFVTKSDLYSSVVLGELWFSLLYAGYNGAMVIALVEIVPKEIRSISFSLAYSIATAIYGGFTPALATQLIHFTQNKAAPAMWLSFAAFCSFMIVLGLSARIKKIA